MTVTARRSPFPGAMTAAAVAAAAAATTALPPADSPASPTGTLLAAPASAAPVSPPAPPAPPAKTSKAKAGRMSALLRRLSLLPSGPHAPAAPPAAPPPLPPPSATDATGRRASVSSTDSGREPPTSAAARLDAHLFQAALTPVITITDAAGAGPTSPRLDPRSATTASAATSGTTGTSAAATAIPTATAPHGPGKSRVKAAKTSKAKPTLAKIQTAIAAASSLASASSFASGDPPAPVSCPAKPSRTPTAALPPSPPSPPSPPAEPPTTRTSHRRSSRLLPGKWRLATMFGQRRTPLSPIADVPAEDGGRSPVEPSGGDLDAAAFARAVGIAIAPDDEDTAVFPAPRVPDAPATAPAEAVVPACHAPVAPVATPCCCSASGSTGSRLHDGYGGGGGGGYGGQSAGLPGHPLALPSPPCPGSPAVSVRSHSAAFNDPRLQAAAAAAAAAGYVLALPNETPAYHHQDTASSYASLHRQNSGLLYRRSRSPAPSIAESGVSYGGLTGASFETASVLSTASSLDRPPGRPRGRPAALGGRPGSMSSRARLTTHARQNAGTAPSRHATTSSNRTVGSSHSRYGPKLDMSLFEPPPGHPTLAASYPPPPPPGAPPIHVPSPASTPTPTSIRRQSIQSPACLPLTFAERSLLAHVANATPGQRQRTHTYTPPPMASSPMPMHVYGGHPHSAHGPLRPGSLDRHHSSSSLSSSAFHAPVYPPARFDSPNPPFVGSAGSTLERNASPPPLPFLPLGHGYAHGHAHGHGHGHGSRAGTPVSATSHHDALPLQPGSTHGSHRSFRSFSSIHGGSDVSVDSAATGASARPRVETLSRGRFTLTREPSAHYTAGCNEMRFAAGGAGSRFRLTADDPTASDSAAGSPAPPAGHPEAVAAPAAALGGGDRLPPLPTSGLTAALHGRSQSSWAPRKFSVASESGSEHPSIADSGCVLSVCEDPASAMAHGAVYAAGGCGGAAPALALALTPGMHHPAPYPPPALRRSWSVAPLPLSPSSTPETAPVPNLKRGQTGAMMAPPAASWHHPAGP
ncbi:hypothetical protein CXG81DRAFT_28579 [Caulochytrium protostelioides]|uniref:Uncharacterized protein n=1 Tax=Caulochytrium protostelioides TaxID=1555241 RepID=A0A4P9WYR8_9FUNG|nr:hypothetical protein CXG81DRAFT_28579 [Caulochytrium protostelioides]|eukprot:RKO98614.1 hypothetical protein CXG81DRAFT_28579 [Caulochytrium protostelioides]